MPFRYELMMRTGPVSTWHVTGPGLDLRGEGRRGYLTLPPLDFCESDGVVVARFGGNRRVAPSRHLLQSSDGRVLATFGTHLVASVVERRRTIVTDGGCDELCTLVPMEAEVSGVKRTLAAAVDGGYMLTRRDEIIGRLGSARLEGPGRFSRRAGDLARQAIRRARNIASEHLAGVVESEIRLDPLLATALLVYKRWVLDVSRVPES